jgi:L,D-peptidoglycan transpeptidase YkuD (ErfK/YbiS/YcfS/YnhG family)
MYRRRRAGWYPAAFGVVLIAVLTAACQSRPATAPPPQPATTTTDDTATPSLTGPTSPAPTTPVPATAANPTPVRTTAPTNLASRLKTLPANTTQVVVVHAINFSTTYATIETFQKSGGAWRAAFPPMSGRIGSNGFTDTPAEGLSATPTGVYSFGGTFYGNSPSPGLHYAYHHLVVGDYWDENPASPTYNTFIHGSDPGGASEALWQSPTAYSYFAFITYNLSAVPGKGSAILLHQNTGAATAGCVSLPRGDLVEVLTWLNPSADPRIVMGPDSVLDRY